MLWLDDSSTPIEDKVRRAAAYYETKYGHEPTRCRMRMATAGEGFAKLSDVDGIKIVIDSRVLPQHLWLGTE